MKMINLGLTIKCFDVSPALSGPLHLSQRHACGHLRPPQQAGVQRPPGVPSGQRRLPALSGCRVSDHPLCAWRPHLPHRGERGHPLLCGLRVTGGHPG